MKRFLLLFYIFMTSGIIAQKQAFISGLAPEFSISYRLNEKFKLTSKIESWQQLTETSTKNSNWDYKYNGTDIQGFVGYDINPFWKMAMGYQYGTVQNQKNNHRSIQQISYIQRFWNFRFGHRFRADQTFYDSDPVKFRTRYRLSAEIPLQGMSIDPGEVYMILSDELLCAFTLEDKEIENRLSISMGVYFENKSKLQCGIDYRNDDYLNSLSNHKVWFKAGYYLRI